MTTTDDSVLRLERVFKAPVQRVYDAWTDPDQLANWFGPEGMHVPERSVDARVGGAYRLVIENADGGQHVCSGTYTELEPPTRLVFTWAWETDGIRGHETVCTVVFEPNGNDTLMRFEQRIFESAESRSSHNDGWCSALNKLDNYISA